MFSLLIVISYCLLFISCEIDEFCSGDNSHLLDSRYCLWVVETSYNWFEGEEYCQSNFGGHLVSISSSEKKQDVEAVLGAYAAGNEYWLGLSDDLHDKEWSWISGNEEIVESWDDGEPIDTLENKFAYIDGTGVWRTSIDDTKYIICDRDEESLSVPCENGIFLENNKCVWFVTTPLSWSSAEDYCLSEFGGYLLSAGSHSEVNMMKVLMKSNAEASQSWIGYEDSGSGFSWSNGVQPGVSAWSVVPGSTGCAAVDSSSDYLWLVEDCSEEKTFMCERRNFLIESFTVNEIDEFTMEAEIVAGGWDVIEDCPIEVVDGCAENTWSCVYSNGKYTLKREFNETDANLCEFQFSNGKYRKVMEIKIGSFVSYYSVFEMQVTVPDPMFKTSAIIFSFNEMDYTGPVSQDITISRQKDISFVVPEPSLFYQKGTLSYFLLQYTLELDISISSVYLLKEEDEVCVTGTSIAIEDTYDQLAEGVGYSVRIPDVSGMGNFRYMCFLCTVADPANNERRMVNSVSKVVDFLIILEEETNEKGFWSFLSSVYNFFVRK